MYSMQQWGLVIRIRQVEVNFVCLLYACKKKGRLKQLKLIVKVDDAIMKAQSLIDSAEELGINPKKVIFGGRKLFRKLQKKHINGRPYRELKTKW